MPSACHVPVEVVRENVPLPCVSTVLMGLATIGNRSRREASGAFAQSVRMRDNTVYGKGAEVAHHHASMRKPTKAEMSSNAPSIGSKISAPSQPATKNADTTIWQS